MRYLVADTVNGIVSQEGLDDGMDEMRDVVNADDFCQALRTLSETEKIATLDTPDTRGYVERGGYGIKK
jgi:hypothetical protein